MKRFLALVCFAAAVLMIFPACSSRKKTPSVLLTEAVAAGKNGDWQTALKLSSEALDDVPANRDILLFSALALENMGRTEEALNRVQGLAADQDDFMVQYTLGRMLYKKGNLEQCIVPLKNAERASGRDMNTLVLLAKASTRLNTKDAIDYQKKLLTFSSFSSSPEVFNELGVIYAMRGNYKQALACLLGRRATLPVSVLNAAIVLDWYMGDKEQAKIQYQKYLRITANSPELERERIAVSRRQNELR